MYKIQSLGRAGLCHQRNQNAQQHQEYDDIDTVSYTHLDVYKRQVSTFRIAADFCEEFDGFVFNHNEALLYEWVEEYEPALFQRLQRLVQEKKWHIMGGWYLQPDCVMPSGESLTRQIETGRKYFLEKFGVTPTTAINFDPFGHTRGLVQIMKKAGYDSYIFMRGEMDYGCLLYTSRVLNIVNRQFQLFCIFIYHLSHISNVF